MTPLIYFRRPSLITQVEGLLAELAQSKICSLVLAPEMGGLKLLDPDVVVPLKELTCRYGVTTPAVHGLFRHTNDLNSDRPTEMVADHCRMLRHVAELGVKTYVVHAGLPLGRRTQAEEWSAVNRALDEILPTAQEVGIVLAVENLPPEYLGNNPEDLVTLVERFNSSHLKLCFDSGHAHMCADPAWFLRQMAPYVVTMHLHDNDGCSDRHLNPGDGTLHWDSLVPEINRCPNLIHLEIEAFNREGHSHADIWNLYVDLLKSAD